MLCFSLQFSVSWLPLKPAHNKSPLSLSQGVSVDKGYTIRIDGGKSDGLIKKKGSGVFGARRGGGGGQVSAEC